MKKRDGETVKNAVLLEELTAYPLVGSDCR
jgi:hypothetical protein